MSAANGHPSRAAGGGDGHRGRLAARDRPRGDVAIGERGTLRRRPDHALRRLRLAGADGVRGPRLRPVRLHGPARGAAHGPLRPVRRGRRAHGLADAGLPDRPRRRGHRGDHRQRRLGAGLARGAARACCSSAGPTASRPSRSRSAWPTWAPGRCRWSWGCTGPSRPSAPPAPPAPTPSARRSTSSAAATPAPCSPGGADTTHHALLPRRVRRDAGALAPQRRPGRSGAALRPRPRRLPGGRGRRRAGAGAPRGAPARAAPRSSARSRATARAPTPTTSPTPTRRASPRRAR